MNLTDTYLQPGRSLDRLRHEYARYGSLVVAFDFDNTVYDYHQTGETYPEVVALLRRLHQVGCWLVCFTANEDLLFIRNYLTNNAIPFAGINENPPFYHNGQPDAKIYYNALLDDRAGLRQVFDELTQLLVEIEDSTKSSCQTI